MERIDNFLSKINDKKAFLAVLISAIILGALAAWIYPLNFEGIVDNKTEDNMKEGEEGFSSSLEGFDNEPGVWKLSEENISPSIACRWVNIENNTLTIAEGFTHGEYGKAFSGLSIDEINISTDLRFSGVVELTYGTSKTGEGMMDYDSDNLIDRGREKLKSGYNVIEPDMTYGNFSFVRLDFSRREGKSSPVIKSFKIKTSK